MENRELQEIQVQYNYLYKEMDDIYHSLANHYGISNTALWILYILRESDGPFTQSKICDKLSLSKQTIHSALKNLEAVGHVTLESLAGSRKNKRVVLTPKGETFVSGSIDRIFEMEFNALRQFSSQERELFLQLNQKYVEGLKKESEKIIDAGE